MPDGRVWLGPGPLRDVPGPGVVLAKLRLPEPREQVRRAGIGFEEAEIASSPTLDGAPFSASRFELYLILFKIRPAQIA